MTVELAGGDGTAIANAMKDPDNEYDMYLGGYIMGIDPDTFSSLFENDGAYNYMHYSGYDTIDQLFEEGRSELDEICKKGNLCKTAGSCPGYRCFLSDHFQQQDPGCKQQNPGCGRCRTCSGIYLRGYFQSENC